MWNLVVSVPDQYLSFSFMYLTIEICGTHIMRFEHAFASRK